MADRIKELKDKIQGLRLAYGNGNISEEEYLRETTKLWNEISNLEKAKELEKVLKEGFVYCPVCGERSLSHVKVTEDGKHTFYCKMCKWSFGVYAAMWVGGE